MTLKIFFQAVLEKFHRGNAPAPMSREARVLTHWKIIVVIFLLAVVMVFISSFFIYRDINQGDFFPVEKKIGGNLAPVTAELISQTVSDFKTKSATFNQLKKNGAVSVDPSR